MKRVVKNAVIGKGKGTIIILCGVVLSFLFTVGGCNKLNRIDLDGKKPPKGQSNCDKDVIISAYEFENAPNDPVTIIDMKIVNNCLKIKFGASGCSGNSWVVELIDAGYVIPTFAPPPQRELRLSLDNKEMCCAYFEKEMSFNIENLQIGGNSVMLNVVGNFILYEY